MSTFADDAATATGALTGAASTRPTLWSAPTGAGDDAELAGKETALQERLALIASRHQRPSFASSLAAEDLVVTDAIMRGGHGIGIFSLDTGRLHAETLSVIDALKARYGLEVERYAPQSGAVGEYVAAHGANAFYDSVEMRKLCCQIRKVEPLNRALAQADAWATGQRREQSVTRGELDFEEHDAARGIAKYNPLVDWTEAEVWAYLRKHDVPLNPLHLRGYPSIGCEPCTRPVKAGEDVRAGRWWWESRDSKECGLHK